MGTWRSKMRARTFSAVLLVLLAGTAHAKANSSDHTFSDGASNTVESSPTDMGAGDQPTSEDPAAAAMDPQSASAAMQLVGVSCSNLCAAMAVITRANGPQLQACVAPCVTSLATLIQVPRTEPDNYLTWPKGDSLFSYMSTRQFAHFNVLLLFGSVVIAGLGSEVVVGQYIVEHLDPEAAAALWVYAQVCFPLFISIGVFAQSVFGLPFLVLGMWKFGFPETLCYFVKVKQNAEQRGFLNGATLGNLCNALGLLFHHVSSAYFVTCGSVGYNQLTRYARAMMTPLVLQHWVVLTRYVNFTFYCVLAFLLEMVWEFEVFYGVRYLKKNFEVAIVFLLIAHWLFLLATAFEAMDQYFHPELYEQEEEEEEEDPLSINFQNPNVPEKPKEKPKKVRQSYMDTRTNLMGAMFDLVEAAEEGEEGDTLAPLPCGPRGRVSILSAGLSTAPAEGQAVAPKRPKAPKSKGRHSIAGWKTTLNSGK